MASMSDVPLLDEPGLHRYTVDEFLAVAGALEQKVELIDGVVFDVSGETADHIRLAAAVLRALWSVRPQLEVVPGGTVRLEPHGAPIPDVAVYRKGADTTSRYFKAADMLLAVMVSPTTQGRDRAKLIDYGRAGIPEVWVLDRRHNGDVHVFVYCRPDRERGIYQTSGEEWWGLDLNDHDEWANAVESWITTF